MPDDTHAADSTLAPMGEFPQFGIGVATGLTVYAVVQVLTGIEIGTAVAFVVLTGRMSLPAALAWGLPLGLPLVALQTMGLGLLAARAHGLRART